MKVAHVFKDFWPPVAAGITRYVADIADECARRGCEVEVHVAGVRRSRRDVLPSGVVVHRHREFARILSSPLSPGLVRDARRIEADIIHVHMPNPLGELGALLGRPGRPLVASFHAQLGRQKRLAPIYAPLQQRVLARSSAVLVASESLAQVPEVRVAADRLHVLPYGVSPQFARVEPAAPNGSGALRVLFVGRLVYYKGVDVLLRATAQLEGVNLTIVGDGPLRGELERTARHLGVDRTTRFLGALDDDDLLHEYRNHDVFVLPSVSRAEAFGLAMAEAMCSGLPAVSTRLGTATDWVNHEGKSGMIVPPGDADALARAIDRLRAPDVRRRLGDGARTRALQLFSFARHADGLLDVYRGVLR